MEVKAQHRQAQVSKQKHTHIKELLRKIEIDVLALKSLRIHLYGNPCKISMKHFLKYYFLGLNLNS